MTVSDERLAAYVDGELLAEERAAIDAALVDDPHLSARLAAHRSLRDKVEHAFSDIMREPVPERLLHQATTSASPPSHVAMFRSRPKPAAPTWMWASGGALAAGLALGVVLSPGLLRFSSPTLIGPDMTAHHALAYALDHQLASERGPHPVKIDVTFRATDGHICRTFQTQGVAGLACHKSSAGWTVRMAVPSQREEPGAYQTAASRLPEPVAELAQSLAAAPPLNVDDEVKLKSSGWR